MENSMADFNSDLNRNEKDEIFIAIVLPTLQRSECRSHDFINKENGKRIEWKTDYNYSTNYFWEEVSSIEDGSIGGPFRAARDKIELFAYWFKYSPIVYVFDTQKLVDYLHKNITTDMERKQVPNTGSRGTNYTTVGVCLPRFQVDVDIAPFKVTLTERNKELTHSFDRKTNITCYTFAGISYHSAIKNLRDLTYV
jgi:hypothetical protein